MTETEWEEITDEIFEMSISAETRYCIEYCGLFETIDNVRCKYYDERDFLGCFDDFDEFMDKDRQEEIRIREEEKAMKKLQE